MNRQLKERLRSMLPRSVARRRILAGPLRGQADVRSAPGPAAPLVRSAASRSIGIRGRHDARRCWWELVVLDRHDRSAPHYPRRRNGATDGTPFTST